MLAVNFVSIFLCLHHITVWTLPPTCLSQFHSFAQPPQIWRLLLVQHAVYGCGGTAAAVQQTLHSHALLPLGWNHCCLSRWLHPVPGQFLAVADPLGVRPPSQLPQLLEPVSSSHTALQRWASWGASHAGHAAPLPGWWLHHQGGVRRGVAARAGAGSSPCQEVVPVTLSFVDDCNSGEC